MAGYCINVPCEQSGAAGKEGEWPPCRRRLWSTRAAFWGYCVKKRNYKQRKKKDHWGITVDFREKERAKEMLRSRTVRKNWGRKVRAWACRRREKMLDLNISNGPSSPLPLGRLWVSGLLLSLDFRCCRCFWNHPHPTIRCLNSIIPPHSSLSFGVYVAQHINDRFVPSTRVDKTHKLQFPNFVFIGNYAQGRWINPSMWPIHSLKPCWLVSNQYAPLTSMHFHVNKVAPLPRGTTSLSAGNPQSYPATEPPWTVHLVSLGKNKRIVKPTVTPQLSLNTGLPRLGIPGIIGASSHRSKHSETTPSFGTYGTGSSGSPKAQ